MNKHIKLSAVILPLSLQSCVTTTLVDTEEKRPVKFTSASSAQTFYEAYNLTQGVQKNSVTAHVGLPYSHRRVKGPQAKLNAAYIKADTNKDSRITLQEAKSYSKGIPAN